MSQSLNLEGFFQRPLVPIGRHDREALRHIYARANGEQRRFNDWLIALMWHEDETDAGWKVVVYPVDEGAVFWVVPPLFCTASPSTFDKAWKLSEVIRASSREDELTEKFIHPYWDDWAKVK